MEARFSICGTRYSINVFLFRTVRKQDVFWFVVYSMFFIYATVITNYHMQLLRSSNILVWFVIK